SRPRQSWCSPRRTPSRCPICSADGFSLSTQTVEQSTRTWSSQDLAWSLVLTARAGPPALLGLDPGLDGVIIPTGITGDRHTTGITGIEFTTIIITTTVPTKLAT